MMKRNPKERQSPFEKHFYRHLNNVQITLNQLNESIRSSRKLRSEQQCSTQLVKVKEWQNQSEDADKKKNKEYKNQKNSFVGIRILFLVLIWIFGVAYLMRPKTYKNVRLSKQDWEKLVVKQFSRTYSFSNSFKQEVEKLNSLSFAEYCLAIKAQWLCELNPYYSSIVESQLNNLWKLGQNEAQGFSIFEANSTFISFHAFEIKKKKGVFSFKLNITFIQYDFKELQRLYFKQTSQQLMDKQTFNHIYLQQNIIASNLFQNGILEHQQSTSQ
ncbi:hypothetical protein ABPG74_017753 [Tetrahymena malaccensis]